MNNYHKETPDLLAKVFSPSRATQLGNKLKAFNILTVEQLFGAINPLLPDLSKSEIKNKALFASYETAKKKTSSPEYRTEKLKKLLHISSSEAKKIELELRQLDIPVQAFKTNKSAWSLGMIARNEIHRSSFWTSASFYSTKETYIIPHYDRMGIVFSQGHRGTCVANACCSLADYLANDRTSRQFLYHQCKMVDGIKHEEGTYVETAMQVLTRKDLVDYGIVKDTDWSYNPNIGSTKHQGPPPEKCFSTLRYYHDQIVYTRQDSVVDDIKRLLTGSDIHNPAPVVIGVSLFESFQNPSSNRTGWITMPLPGESPRGGHAMLVVGYFEKEKLFLVRNSWGTSWAYDNPYGYAGHALIPYRYIRDYCQSAATILSLDKEHFEIPASSRLYNNRLVVRNSKSLRAAGTKKAKSTRKKSRRKKGVVNNLIWIFAGVAISLLVVYYKEVYEFILRIRDMLERF